MLLCLDTSSPTVSVALAPLDGGAVHSRSSERPMKHGEELAPAIAGVLADASVDRLAISCIAVGVGPAPFTGLRVGLMTARTLGHALDVPVVGVCSLDVIALDAVRRGSVEGEFLVATDARRKEVYLARYSDEARRLDGPEVIRPAEAATEEPVAGEGATLYPDAFGDPREPWRVDAAVMAAGVLDDAFEQVAPEPMYLRRPDAMELR